MRSFFTGVGRLYHVATGYLDIIKTVKNSENWGTEWHRIRHPFEDLQPIDFAMKAYGTYTKVNKLYAEAQYEAAGLALVNDLFRKQ